LRSEILSAAVMFGESTTVRQARRIFSDWMNNNKTISPNLREVVYTAGTYKNSLGTCFVQSTNCSCLSPKESNTEASKNGNSAGHATTRPTFPASGASCSKPLALHPTRGCYSGSFKPRSIKIWSSRKIWNWCLQSSLRTPRDAFSPGATSEPIGGNCKTRWETAQRRSEASSAQSLRTFRHRTTWKR